MEIRSHLNVTGKALLQWLLAQMLESLCVALLWLAGLLILRVPWAPFWALLAAGFSLIPHIGGILSLIGPFLALVVHRAPWEHLMYLLFIYVAVMMVDGFVLQPILLRRMSKVPVWASIIVPLVLGYFLSFWGVILSAPLLAIFFALRTHRKEMKEPPPVEVIPPEVGSHRRSAENPPIIEG